ncbi:MAG: 16S rRNA (uracil(1498)-N(3))-methyltransferase [Pyrinomonadaceae bacterium]
MRRFYVKPEDIENDSAVLDPEQAKHLKNVLRLAEGEKIRIFDGAGNEFLCEILVLRKNGADLSILRQVEPVSPESPLELTLAAALLKIDKFELVVQKAVELGVSKLVPLVTKRTDVKAKNIEQKMTRWRKIITESSKQCGRAKLLEIAAPLEFEAFVKTLEGERILFAETGGESFETLKPDKKITAVIGPEGGWDDPEIGMARDNGFHIITLGGRILRAETASISIAALIQNHFGDLN